MDGLENLNTDRQIYVFITLEAAYEDWDPVNLV